MPDVPALAEFPALANYALMNGVGLFAPVKTPDPILTKFAKNIADANVTLEN